jgi:hypothetical protein
MFVFNRKLCNASGVESGGIRQGGCNEGSASKANFKLFEGVAHN